MRYTLINPVDDDEIYFADTQEHALEQAIALNQSDERHPAIMLYDNKGHHIATLHRNFGGNQFYWYPR